MLTSHKAGDHRSNVSTEECIDDAMLWKFQARLFYAFSRLHSKVNGERFHHLTRTRLIAPSMRIE